MPATRGVSAMTDRDIPPIRGTDIPYPDLGLAIKIVEEIESGKLSPLERPMWAYQILAAARKSVSTPCFFSHEQKNDRRRPH